MPVVFSKFSCNLKTTLVGISNILLQLKILMGTRCVGTSKQVCHLCFDGFCSCVYPASTVQFEIRHGGKVFDTDVRKKKNNFVLDATTFACDQQSIIHHTVHSLYFEQIYANTNFPLTSKRIKSKNTIVINQNMNYINTTLSLFKI